jgi:hypothetical protein
MKAIIKNLIVFLVINTTNIKAQSQNYYLGVPDNIDDLGCGNWCWVHASLNVIHYYGDYFPSKMEIVEWQFINGQITNVHPSVTSCIPIPDSCCKTSSVENILTNWGLRHYTINGILDKATLINEFKYNQPIIVTVSYQYPPGGGYHYLIAHGIRNETVFMLDPSLGNIARLRTNIWPGKIWNSSNIFKHSPNWSSHNNITGTFNYSQCFSATDSISVNATFSKVPGQPDQYFTLCTSGSVLLYEGFTLSPGCSLDIFTSNSSCP